MAEVSSSWPLSAFISKRGSSSLLDEDALAGAFLGGFDRGVEECVGDVGHPLGPLGVALGVGEDRVALLDVGQAVVEEGEHVGCDLLAEAVARAQVLIDPDLHGDGFSFGSGKRTRCRTVTTSRVGG